MSRSTDRTEIEALLERLKQAHHDKDAATSAAEYADPVVYNLAPPLKVKGGVETLAGLTNLIRLNLAHTRVTDAGAEVIRRALPYCYFSHSYSKDP